VERKRDLERQISEYSDQVRHLEDLFRKSQNEEDILHDRVRVLDEERTTLSNEVKAIRLLYTELESSKIRLAQQEAKKRTEEEKVDTTDADLAKVEQQQQQTVMERVEHSLTLEVSPPPPLPAG
jgi:hypothetical protein